MNRIRSARPLVRDRRGFSIVELVVAVMILSVGVLGLAGTAAVVTQHLGSADLMSQSATLAQVRFEGLRARGCAAITGASTVVQGDSTAGNLTERWTASDVTRAVSVVDSITYTVRGRTTTHVYRSMIPCTTV